MGCFYIRFVRMISFTKKESEMTSPFNNCFGITTHCGLMHLPDGLGDYGETGWVGVAYRWFGAPKKAEEFCRGIFNVIRPVPIL